MGLVMFSQGEPIVMKKYNDSADGFCSTFSMKRGKGLDIKP